MVNRVTVKLIIRYCPIKIRYQFIWTHKIKFCKRKYFYCGSLNRGTEIHGDGGRGKGSRSRTKQRSPGAVGLEASLCAVLAAAVRRSAFVRKISRSRKRGASSLKASLGSNAWTVLVPR